MDLIGRIKYKAAEQGLTIQALEKASGLSNGSISKWKNSSPKSEALARVADCLGCSTDYLLGRDDYPISEEEWKNTPVALSSPEGYDALTEEGKRQIMELIKMLPKKTDK